MDRIGTWLEKEHTIIKDNIPLGFVLVFQLFHWSRAAPGSLRTRRPHAARQVRIKRKIEGPQVGQWWWANDGGSTEIDFCKHQPALGLALVALPGCPTANVSPPSTCPPHWMGGVDNRARLSVRQTK